MVRITAKNLKKIYNRKISLSKKSPFEAVKSLDLQVKNHEVLSIVGKNGAGKTTVVKMLAGVMAPTEGTVFVDGENPFCRTREYRKKVTLVLGQKGQMDVDVSILDNALYFAAIYGIKKREAIMRIYELADLLEISDCLKQQVRTLSLGQKMKGEFLIAFLHKPTIIYLDEPTLGLDYSTQRLLRQFLNDYKTKNDVAMVLTSHNIEDIESLSDSILIIDKGQKIFEGTIQKLRGKIETRKELIFQYEGKPQDIPFEVKRIGMNKFSVSIKESQERWYLEKLIDVPKIKDISIEAQNLNEIIEQLYDN